MKQKGVSYDVGRVFGGNWRPVFNPEIINRELAIIKNDLHCNAVRICGKDIGRLMIAAEDALQQGLEVWLSPELWNKSPERTLAYIVRAATMAEKLRERWPERLIFLVGSEFTLFMQGIIEGKSFMKRVRNAFRGEIVKTGKHNKPLNEFLARANSSVRKVFQGKVTYASLIWEQVDWSIFDFVGVDHYRDARINDKYVEMLKPLFAYHKPIVVTEFGMRTYQGAESSGTLGLGIADFKSMVLHKIPIVGWFVRPRLKGDYIRDEELPAHENIETLRILDTAGVDGAFIMTFVQPLDTYDENSRYDLDMNSFALVKSYAHGKRGTTYPDMLWDPKEAFRTVADYYKEYTILQELDLTNNNTGIVTIPPFSDSQFELLDHYHNPHKPS